MVGSFTDKGLRWVGVWFLVARLMFMAWSLYSTWEVECGVRFGYRGGFVDTDLPVFEL